MIVRRQITASMRRRARRRARRMQRESPELVVILECALVSFKALHAPDELYAVVRWTTFCRQWMFALWRRVGLRGRTFLDTSFVYAPYIPIVIDDAKPIGSK